MSRRLWLGIAVFAVATSACGRLGTGLPSCRTPPTNPNAAIVLSLQAVPDAEYIPCLNSLELGWEEVDFAVESGKATLKFEHDLHRFLEVTLTPSCDVGDAAAVPSGFDGVTRYEDVFAVTEAVRVTIIPEGERALIYSQGLAADLEGTVVDDRPVAFAVDEDTQYPVRSRVNRAFFTDQFVWIVGDLDVDEETLEMRMVDRDDSFRGIDVHDALELIEDMSADVTYQGNWYLLFDGGCVTYEFDAGGTLATSIAADTEETVGLYPSEPLLRAARDAGYDLGDE